MIIDRMMISRWSSNTLWKTAAVALALAACTACGESPAPPAPAPAPAATPPPAAGPRVYVSDETGGSVAVIDPDAGQVVERIAVGKRPRGILLSRDGSRLFVALSGNPIGGPGVDETKLPPPDRSADGIGVVDLTTHTVVRMYRSGQDPETFDVSPDGSMLYVSNEDAAEMTALDLASGEVRARVKVGEEPEGVTVRPDGREVLVTCEADNTIAVVDTENLKVVTRIKVGPRPRFIVFAPDGTTAFVTIENAAAVDVIDAVQHKTIGTVKISQTGPPGTIPPRPMSGVLSRDGGQLFVSLGRAKSVAVIDVAGRKLIRTIDDVGTRPWGIGLSPDGRKLYTANGPSGDVSVIDVATGRVDRRIAVGGSPWGIAVAASARP